MSGVGDQGHLDTRFGWSPTLMAEDRQRYTTFGLKVAITEADVRTLVNNVTDQVPTDNLALFAQPYELSEMMMSRLGVYQCISFTVRDLSDAVSWVPGTFLAEGYAPGRVDFWRHRSTRS